MASNNSSGFPKVELPNFDAERVLGALRDAAYVVIGFGVLTVQQIQSRTRDFVTAVENNPLLKQLGIDRSQVEELVSRYEQELAKLDERFEEIEARIDSLVESVEARLPEQAAAVVGQAHDIAKAARKQMRGLLRAA